MVEQASPDAVGELKGLRDDVYRRPLATALSRLVSDPVGAAWTSAPAEAMSRWRWPRWSAGTGGSTPSTAIPRRETKWRAPPPRDAQVIALTQAGEDLSLPEEVDLAFCRFLLLHVIEPEAVVRMMAVAVRPGGWVVAQEPITSAGRIAGSALSMPDARHPDVGALLPALVRDAGLQVVDAWAEAPAGVGPGPVTRYLESLTGVDPEDDPVVLPPLVTVIGRRA